MIKRPHIHGFAELITKTGREARKKNKIKPGTTRSKKPPIVAAL